MKGRIIQLIESGEKNQSEIARIIAKETKQEFNEGFRRRVAGIIHRHNNSAIKMQAESLGIDLMDIKNYWHKSEHFSINVKGSDLSKQIDFDDIITECLAPYTPKEKIKYDDVCETFDRLVWTDVHVGMDASQGGTSLYDVEWNKEILLDRVVQMAQYILLNKKSEVLYIDELGDFLDGWNGQTTRGGHTLPQNMNNQEAFDTGLKAKMLLIDILQSEYKMIQCNNICNDNHSGDFSYILNSAFKQIIDHKYDNVSVTNYKKFINSYSVGDHVIVLSHGKDSQHLKYGFKPQLDAKQIEKIDQFMKHNNIYSKGKYIEFSKGDSHQCLFDMCTSDDFHYFNYPAFSPSSNWVQHNFKKGRSGFVFMTYDYYGPNKQINPYFFSC